MLTAELKGGGRDKEGVAQQPAGDDKFCIHRNPRDSPVPASTNVFIYRVSYFAHLFPSFLKYTHGILTPLEYQSEQENGPPRPNSVCALH